MESVFGRHEVEFNMPDIPGRSESYSTPGGGGGSYIAPVPRIRIIDVANNIIDAHGHPIYLMDTDGRLYNWQNIISIRKVS